MQIRTCDTCGREVASKARGCGDLDDGQGSLLVWASRLKKDHGFTGGVVVTSSRGGDICNRCLAKLFLALLPLLKKAAESALEGSGGYRTMWRSKLVDDK